jgi:hypothetical protein
MKKICYVTASLLAYLVAIAPAQQAVQRER